MDVFPDDLDRQIAGQMSSHVGPKQFFELTLNRAKARLIDDRQRVSEAVLNSGRKVERPQNLTAINEKSEMESTSLT